MSSVLETNDQVLHFLRSWSDAPEIETHAARVFLRGGTALKIKRPVHYDFLDFRTLDGRKGVLDRELELNKPNAPMIYDAVVPITKSSDGNVAIDGPGDVVEWALKMKRFPKGNELSEIARSGALDLPMAEELGEMVHDMHAKARMRNCDGAELIAEILKEFRREFAALEVKAVKLDVAMVLEGLKTESERLSKLLHDRSRAGFVRRCHGDLHMRNIVWLNGQPVAFDALEFSERLGTCDVLYDLAFLLMDLEVAGHHAAANSVLNAYVSAEPDPASLHGLKAMGLFMAVRAVVRAMVAAEQFALSNDTAKLQEAKKYVAYASRTIKTEKAVLHTIGGLSGTGKTTLARAIRAGLGGHGAIHIRSDIERKRLAGVSAHTRLSATHYTKTSSANTYAKMRERAQACLTGRMPVIMDAVFADPQEREMIENLAKEFGVEFRPVWLAAPEDTRSRRVTNRQNDASDADAEVVMSQSKNDCGPITWPIVPTGGTFDDTLKAVRKALRGQITSMGQKNR